MSLACPVAGLPSHATWLRRPFVRPHSCLLTASRSGVPLAIHAPGQQNQLNLYFGTYVGEGRLRRH